MDQRNKSTQEDPFGGQLGTRLGRRFESVLEAMADGVWVCDATPRLLWINSACEELNDIRREDVCGLSVEELLGRGNFDTDVSHRVLQSRKPVVINQKVRSGRTLLVTGVPVFDDEGEILFIVGNERDLTELNSLREELEHKHQLNRRMSSELLAMKLRDLKADEIVAESEGMERVLDTAFRVADFDTTVLISGPTGVGKSMIASLLHEGSSRREAPFMSLNCGAIPPSLIEAELFGYVAGAFTGADRSGKPGLIEAADNGTLFLDEIDAFALDMQVKLLTFLDTRTFIRVGDTRLREVDVRIVAASNKDLAEHVRLGAFREDLWFRLNVVPIEIPGLATRVADVSPLVQKYLARLCKRHGVEHRISSGALDLLCRHDYPGNVRELQNILERAFVLCPGNIISVEDLPEELRRTGLPGRGVAGLGDLRQTIEALEREWLEIALSRHSRQIDIARELGVSQATVARLLQRHGLKSRRPRGAKD